MADEPFDDIDFSSGEEETSAAEFIDSAHDPEILYHHIQDAYEKANSGPQIDTKGKESEIQAHSQVEVFQSTIQYVEAFGIYLLSYIKGKDDLVHNLITTEPKHLQQFFESLKEGSEDDYLDNIGVEKDYRNLLEELFGYAFIDDIDDDVSQEELEEAVEESVDVLDANIRRIGEFYLVFHDIYNAVKHGNRVLPQLGGEYSLSTEGREETSLDLDMDFVLFLCRNEYAEPYLVSVPISYLLKHSIDVTEKVRHVFNHLKKISEADFSGETVDISFFQFTEYDDDSGYEWITVTQSSGVVILPRIEELEELMEPGEWSFPAKIKVDHGTLYLKTEQDDSVSEEYPLEVTVLQEGVVGLTPRPILGIDFDVDIESLDVVQYFEFVKLHELHETDGLDEIVIVDEQADEVLETQEPRNFAPGEPVEELLSYERLEQLYWLQKISGERIPIPFNLAPSQIDVIDRCIESNPDTEEAVEAVEELREIGQENDWTTVYADICDPSGGVLRSETIVQFPGMLNFEDIESEDDESADVEWGDPGHGIRAPIVGFEGSYDDLVEIIEEDPENIEQILNNVNLNPDDSVVYPLWIDYEFNEPGFWYAEHELRFEFLANQPKLKVRQQCPLCGLLTAQDLRSHLLESCDASP